uniref:Wsv440-like protein n=1 Tax=Metapenaeus ensis nimavirus TaxID=2133794 RepID=A0A401IPD7_9VIRU|nr:MAG: wsv440-like protein [Metapenaeus ensis nimavirus]GBG35477.1 wsv440-like protein [Metapenaeus ensis nimavirus]
MDAQKAEKLVRWFNDLACGCPMSVRVSRVLGSLGGGVDAASIRSRPKLEKAAAEKVPERISSLIEGVLLERALFTPDLAAAAFDVSDKLTYCTCNTTRGNFNLSSMMVWLPNGSSLTPNSPMKVTCPSCTIEYNNGGNGDKKPVPLISFFRHKAEQEVSVEKAETKQLYAAVLGVSGGCGVYNRSRQATFNGSWTCLLFNDKNLTTVEAEVVVSNRISHSVRLQPLCICPELLYAVCSIEGGSEFAYRVRDLAVVGGGEFLYFKYTIFEEHGPFDSRTDLKYLVDTEPVSEPGCLMAAAAAAASSGSSGGGGGSGGSRHGEDGEEIVAQKRGDNMDWPSSHCLSSPLKRRKVNVEEVSRMSLINEVDTQSLLMTVLGGAKRTGVKRRVAGSFIERGNSKKKRRDEAACGPTATVVATSDNQEIDKCKANYILPSPQIEEQTIESYQRHSHMTTTTKVAKHPIRIGANTFNVDVRPFRKRYVMPPSHILFSPPLILRMSFNCYKVITGAPAFFDRIEVEGPSGPTVLNNNAAHSATLKVLSYIRENSLKRWVKTAQSKGLNLLIKTPTTSIGIPVTTREIRNRQLCTATTLSMLAGLAK